MRQLSKQMTVWAMLSVSLCLAPMAHSQDFERPSNLSTSAITRYKTVPLMNTKLPSDLVKSETPIDQETEVQKRPVAKILKDGRLTIAKGGSCGGGGTTVKVDHQILLLDFLRVKLPEYQNFQDPEQVDFIRSQPQTDSNFPESFHKSRFSEEFTASDQASIISEDGNILNRILIQKSGLVEIKTPKDFFYSDPMRLAINVLKEWEDNSVFSVQVGTPIYSLFSPVVWEFHSDFSKDFSGEVADLTDFKNDGISDSHLAAYYRQVFDEQNPKKSQYDILISAKQWNNLSLMSQTGVIIHEGLRHFQFLNLGQDQVDVIFDDSNLQVVTSIVLLCKPRPVLSQYINYLLLGSQEMAKNLSQYGTAEQVIQKYCIPSFSREKNTLNEMEEWTRK